MGKKLQSLRGAGTVTVCDIAIPYRNAGLSSSFSLTICLSDNAPGRKASALALATHVGELDGVPGSWFCPGPALAVLNIWRANQ